MHGRVAAALAGVALLVGAAPAAGEQAAGEEVAGEEAAAAGELELVACGPYDACMGAVDVRGLPVETLAALAERDPSRVEWARAFAVRVAGPFADGEPPPVLGDWSVVEGAVRFEPRFPLDGGVGYVARFDGTEIDRLAGLPAGTTPSFTRPFSTPAAFALPNAVEAVHPSGERVPANLLRLYVHFRFPVFAKQVHRRVHLLDEAGEEVPLAFVEVEGGLWDPEQKRLTLLLHPGRVKRGVAPGEAMGGPPLVAGKRYTLRIDRELRDGYGNPMLDDFEHSFEVTAADRTPPDPGAWAVEPPGDAEGPLEVVLDGPLDHALAARLIAVLGENGRALAGRVEMAEGETRWRFHPEEPWRPGPHALAVHPHLEDPAGNRPGRPFDRDLQTEEAVETSLEIPFLVEPLPPHRGVRGEESSARTTTPRSAIADRPPPF